MSVSKNGSPQHFRFHAYRLFVFISLSWLAGCGGGEEPAPAPMAAPPAPPKPAVVAVPAGRSEEAEAGPANDAGEKPKPVTKITVSGAEANNLFVVPGVQQNYLLASAEQTQQFLAAQREIVVPMSGLDNSSSFAIVSRPQSNLGNPAGQNRLPRYFVPIPEAGYDSSGWPRRIRCEIDNSIMVFVPAGTFLHGKNGADPSFGPEHSAYLDPFYIDQWEVTVDNYNRYRNYLSESGERAPQAPVNDGLDIQQPALGVLWRDASGYAEFIHKQLPTETEWEKAARGPAGFDHPWGYGRAAWRTSREPGQITAVGQYPTDTSPYGAMDMAGNALEWCSDWYAPDAHKQAVTDLGDVPRNWQGPRKAEPQFHRVIKGGHSNWTVWSRDHASMSDRRNDTGFRCVLRLPGN